MKIQSYSYYGNLSTIYDNVHYHLSISFRICPIFQVSNVTGANLNLLKKFLNLLPSRMSRKEDEPPEFLIDETYSVPVKS